MEKSYLDLKCLRGHVVRVSEEDIHLNLAGNRVIVKCDHDLGNGRTCGSPAPCSAQKLAVLLGYTGPDSAKEALEYFQRKRMEPPSDIKENNVPYHHRFLDANGTIDYAGLMQYSIQQVERDPQTRAMLIETFSILAPGWENDLKGLEDLLSKDFGLPNAVRSKVLTLFKRYCFILKKKSDQAARQIQGTQTSKDIPLFPGSVIVPCPSCGTALSIPLGAEFIKCPICEAEFQRTSQENVITKPSAFSFSHDNYSPSCNFIPQGNVISKPSPINDASVKPVQKHIPVFSDKQWDKIIADVSEKMRSTTIPCPSCNGKGHITKKINLRMDLWKIFKSTDCVCKRCQGSGVIRDSELTDVYYRQKQGLLLLRIRDLYPDTRLGRAIALDSGYVNLLVGGNYRLLDGSEYSPEGAEVKGSDF